jgi:hypothetical protein
VQDIVSAALAKEARAAPALTIRQPYASLIASGVKDVENRSRKIGYRGYLWIHAGKQWHSDRFSIENTTDEKHYPLGKIVALANLLDVSQDSSSRWAEPNYWHWEIRPVWVAPSPVPALGRLSLWRPTPQVVGDLLAQMTKRPPT